MTKPKRVAIYTKVSTDGQSVENQRRELLAVARTPWLGGRGRVQGSRHQRGKGPR